MASLIDTLGNFVNDLIENILEKLQEDDPTYAELNAGKAKYLEQLQSVPNDLLNSYIEIRQALASIEVTYCYLCGMRDSHRADVVDPTGEGIYQELSNYEKYRQLQAQASKQHGELQAILPPEYCDLLNLCVKKWDIILGLQKHYCYSGGIQDKTRIDKRFNPANDTEWGKFISRLL